MKGYPLFLNIEGMPCLVFGGGRVALRKIQALLRRGAKVICVSKDFSKALRNLARAKKSQLKLFRIPLRLQVKMEPKHLSA